MGILSLPKGEQDREMQNLRNVGSFRANKCDAYRSRHLTLIGRACIASIVICAQLWNVVAVAVLPDTLITEINRKMFASIWTGKFDVHTYLNLQLVQMLNVNTVLFIGLHCLTADKHI